MKKITAYILLIGIIILSLTYISDLYEMLINKRVYEGYIFAIKIFMFDFAMIIPLIITIALKNTSELKTWGVLGIILQNAVLFMGFKLGAMLGLIIGMTFIFYFITRRKTFNLNANNNS